MGVTTSRTRGVNDEFWIEVKDFANCADIGWKMIDDQFVPTTEVAIVLQGTAYQDLQDSQREVAPRSSEVSKQVQNDDEEDRDSNEGVTGGNRLKVFGYGNGQ